MSYLILGVQNLMLTAEKSAIQFELATLMNSQSNVQADMKAVQRLYGSEGGYEDDVYYQELEDLDAEYTLSKEYLETQLETLEKNCESLEKK